MILLAMQRSGFLSGVTRGGPKPPDILTPTDMPHANSEEAMEEAKVTQENVATRRLWVGLKYWNQLPVLRAVKSISKPKRKITMKLPDMTKIVHGKNVGEVRGSVESWRVHIYADRCWLFGDARGAGETQRRIANVQGGVIGLV